MGKDICGAMTPSQKFREKGIFVTGTDTGVGKTVVAAGLVRLARKLGYLCNRCQTDRDGLSGALRCLVPRRWSLS